MTEYISVAIAAAGLIASVYFSQRNINKSMQEQSARRDADMERRQNDAVAKAKEETERHVEIMGMLRSLADDTRDNKKEISDLKDAVKELNDTQIRNSRDLKTAFDRIEKIEMRFETLLQEHRARAKGGCITDMEMGR